VGQIRIARHQKRHQGATSLLAKGDETLLDLGGWGRQSSRHSSDKGFGQ
jgi:hypothetical protein